MKTKNKPKECKCHCHKKYPDTSFWSGYCDKCAINHIIAIKEPLGDKPKEGTLTLKKLKKLYKQAKKYETPQNKIWVRKPLGDKRGLDKAFHKEFDIVINDGGELQTHYLDVLEWIRDYNRSLVAKTKRDSYEKGWEDAVKSKNLTITVLMKELEKLKNPKHSKHCIQLNCKGECKL